MDEGRYYKVVSNLTNAPVRDYLLHGYETRRDFCDALDRIVRRWRGRVGERIDERHGFYLLRFHDTPGGKPDEEWLPSYLLTEEEDYVLPYDTDERDDYEKELDEIFGF